VYEDDACIHDNALFASGGLFRVSTDQPPRGNGRAGGNLPAGTFLAGGSPRPSGRYAARNILKAGIRKNTTHTWAGVIEFCREKGILHAP